MPSSCLHPPWFEWLKTARKASFAFGTSGTVCVLGAAGEHGEAALQDILTQYAMSTGGYKAQVFSGSSPGAALFGHLRIRRRQPLGPCALNLCL